MLVNHSKNEWEEIQEIKNYRLALDRVKNKVKCPDCDLFECICQTNLNEFWDKKKFLKNKVYEIYRLSLKILNNLNADMIVEKDLARLKKKLRGI